MTEPLVGPTEIAKSAGWWAPYKNACLVSERHSAIRFGDQGRLHSETNLAIEYPDGRGVAANHGKAVSYKKIREEENAAQCPNIR